jgi:type VI secretion system secreted protein Hcp
MSGYIKIGTIKGECIDAGHQGWINLLSVSQGMSRPVKAGVSGSTRQRASVDVGDLVCVKELDASSPKLQEAICKGTNYPEVELHMCTSVGGDKRDIFYKVKMYNAVVNRSP